MWPTVIVQKKQQKIDCVCCGNKMKIEHNLVRMKKMKCWKNEGKHNKFSPNRLLDGNVNPDCHLYIWYGWEFV